MPRLDNASYPLIGNVTVYFKAKKRSGAWQIRGSARTLGRMKPPCDMRCRAVLGHTSGEGMKRESFDIAHIKQRKSAIFYICCMLLPRLVPQRLALTHIWGVDIPCLSYGISPPACVQYVPKMPHWR